MPLRSFWRSTLLVVLFLSSLLIWREIPLLASPAADNAGLLAEEQEALQKAKDAAQRLKIYLNIAEARLKELILFARKLDKENSAKATQAFRSAVIGADNCVAKEQHDQKNYKKLVTDLDKVMKKCNFALLQALDKAAEDFRKYIQSAYEVSQRVQNGTQIQLLRF